MIAALPLEPTPMYFAPTRLAPALLPGALATLALVAISPAQAQAQKAVATPPAATASPAVCPTLLNHNVPRLQDEKLQSLCQYSGKVLLVVNTASYCGFTSQYEGLEALNAKYAARGLVVLGFPSNDFKQEDADSKKIADLCFNTYGVKFPMFTTTPVRGKDAHPLFASLAQATGQAPSWNFNKYLVGRDGKPVAHYGSMTGPTSGTLTAAIEKALAVN